MEDNKTVMLKMLLKLKINQQYQNQQLKQELSIFLNPTIDSPK